MLVCTCHAPGIHRVEQGRNVRCSGAGSTNMPRLLLPTLATRATCKVSPAGCHTHHLALVTQPLLQRIGTMKANSAYSITTVCRHPAYCTCSFDRAPSQQHAPHVSAMVGAARSATSVQTAADRHAAHGNPHSTVALARECGRVVVHSSTGSTAPLPPLLPSSSSSPRPED